MPLMPFTAITTIDHRVAPAPPDERGYLPRGHSDHSEEVAGV